MCVLSQCILSWTTVNVFIFEWIYFLHYPLCLYACLHCHPGVPHHWRMQHLPFFQDLLSSILKWSLWVLIWEWFLYCYLAYTTVLHFCRNLIANISKYEAVVRDIWVGLCVTIVSCYTVKVFASTGI